MTRAETSLEWTCTAAPVSFSFSRPLSFSVQLRVLIMHSGTGASCIYPLLGCAQRARWRFIGTGTGLYSFTTDGRRGLIRRTHEPDIDDESLQYARRNVALNHLERRVSLLKRTPAQALTPKDFIGEKRFVERLP